MSYPAGWYEIRCPWCGAKFTPYEWSHHTPDCPHGSAPASHDEPDWNEL